MKENPRILVNRSAELSEQETEKLRLGQWRLDCPRMQLRSRGKSPIYLYSGPGYIFQPAQGSFVFHLYARQKQKSIFSGLLDRFSSGEIIRDDVYFDLSAEDQQGRKWRSRRILPDTLDRATSGNMIIDGELDELFVNAVLPSNYNTKGDFLKFRAFQRLNIPLLNKTIYQRGKVRSITRNAWNFRYLGVDFRILQEPEGASIEAYSEGNQFPTHFEDRIMGALEFVAGHAVECEFLFIRRGNRAETRLKRTRGNHPVARWQPPLIQKYMTVPGKNRVTSRYHKQLFQSFLRHGFSSDTRLHSIAGQLAAVREASAARYIDAYALTLCVAIESLLLSEFGKIRITIPNEQELKSLLVSIRNWKGSSQIKDRAIGAIGQMRKRRVGDIMRVLLRRGIITELQRKAWEKLRNKSTHEYQSNQNKNDDLHLLLPQVEVLFYHLIFHVVGYKGPYTDYASPNWPVRQYPTKIQGQGE